MSSTLLPHLFRVGLRLFLHADCFGARCLDHQSVPHRRRQVSQRLMRLEDGGDHDFLVDLAVCFGLDHHCRRAAVSSSLAWFSWFVGAAVGVAAPPLPRRPSCWTLGPRSCPSLECCLWRLGCRTGWACWLARIVGAGKGQCVMWRSGIPQKYQKRTTATQEM